MKSKLRQWNVLKIYYEFIPLQQTRDVHRFLLFVDTPSIVVSATHKALSLNMGGFYAGPLYMKQNYICLNINQF